jgi:predicted Zn-dependent protease
MESIQTLIEAALAQSSTDGCIVIGSEESETNLRWAANGLTTNGQMSSRSITVISTVNTPEGTAAGVVTRAVTDLDELAALVRDSEVAARQAAPADDAMPLVDAYANGDDWAAPAAATGVAVFAEFAPALGRAFDAARAHDELLYGFAEHQLSSTWLGTSTGLRRRTDQPDGRLDSTASPPT